jgi:RNA-directed DNA polymerase
VLTWLLRLIGYKKAYSQTKGKPETFDFLEFTHCCSKSQNGKFSVKRKTSRKKYKASLFKAKEWIRSNRNYPKDILIKELNRKLKGYCMDGILRHYQTKGVATDRPGLNSFANRRGLYLLDPKGSFW